MDEVFTQAEQKMEKTIQSLKKEYGSIRAGRANPQVLDKISVDYYGTPTPVNQLASVAVSEARVLVITPWDKTVLKAIEKAIQTSDIGINPQNDGSVLRLTFPPLTEDRRKEIAKDVQKNAENSKVSVRSVRRDSIEKLKTMKKDGEITEDDLKKGEKDMQKITDNYISQIEDLASAKEKEILTV